MKFNQHFYAFSGPLCAALICERVMLVICDLPASKVDSAKESLPFARGDQQNPVYTHTHRHQITFPKRIYEQNDDEREKKERRRRRVERKTTMQN